MSSRKETNILIAVVVLAAIIVVWYLITRDDFVFRNLRRQISQIEHQNYVERVIVDRFDYPNYANFIVELVPEVPATCLLPLLMS